MVFLIVLLFTQSDETFFYSDSKINKYLCL